MHSYIKEKNGGVVDVLVWNEKEILVSDCTIDSNAQWQLDSSRGFCILAV